MRDDVAVVVPWVTEKERDNFLVAWGLLGKEVPGWLILQQDENHEGCGMTKNRGVIQAMDLGAEVVLVLDGDCYPTDSTDTLEQLMGQHLLELEPQNFPLFEAVTRPPSRGTPYHWENRMAQMPVAASMGFWEGNGDHCAVRQLAHDNAKMVPTQWLAYRRWFPLCGMNLAFKPREWWPWCQFIDVPRFDDIWMGWLWQKAAYRRGYCFNLGGPLISHARQSNVWRNLAAEAVHLEASETLWREIALHPSYDYQTLRGLLPC